MPLRRLINALVSRFALPPMPEFPPAESTGNLSPRVDYLLLFGEGVPNPQLVVVMRFPTAEYPTSSSSVSSAVRFRDGNHPVRMRIKSGSRNVEMSFAVDTRTLTLQGTHIALGDHNLMFCDISANNQPVPGSVSLVSATFETNLRGQLAYQELSQVPAVRDFLAADNV